jgi:heat-inducible transcriptional repressor
VPIDDRKQRIMMAIVSLYSGAGEPVGSGLLSQYFNLAVSSATLRNEMAALTRLGLLEQPHTSAGRVPTVKGFRYYVDNLAKDAQSASQQNVKAIDAIFAEQDYDPTRLVSGAAKAFSKMLNCAVVATTPKADDVSIAHFEVLQVGQKNVVIIAVTDAGRVSTRVVRLHVELLRGDAEKISVCLNKYLRFIAAADINNLILQNLQNSLSMNYRQFLPVIKAAIALIRETSKANVYFEGQARLLNWPQLRNNMPNLLTQFSDADNALALLTPKQGRTAIIFGDELADNPMPGLCIITRRYIASGGLWGAVAVIGPQRMHMFDVIPSLEYFCEVLGQGVSGAA